MPSARIPWLAVAGAVLYCAAVTGYLLTHGGWPTPDFLIPPLLVLALFLRRGRSFLLDWTPFLALLLAWEATRGIADRLGAPVHIEEPIRIERALFFGHLPTWVLQGWLFDEERGSQWYDWLGAVLHALYFVLPVVFGFVLWLRDRALYWRYVVSILSLFLLAFIGYVFFPQAPPWLAQPLGADVPFIQRIGVGTIISLPVDHHIVWFYQEIRPNNVASMPSLHGAVPLLLSLILWRLNRPLAWAGFAYTLVLSFFLVYFGEHYVIDLLVGWGLAALLYWLVWATPAWLRGQLPTSMAARRRAIALPAMAVAVLILVAGTAAVLRPGAFGQEPSVLTPAPPEEETPVEHIASTGPCGSTRTFAGETDALLTPVAELYAAYLLDVPAGLCMALTTEQPLLPPDRADQPAIAAESGPPAAPTAVRVGNDALGTVFMLSATGPAGPRLLATGFPPGRYLVVVLLEGITDPEAARLAAIAVTEAVIGNE